MSLQFRPTHWSKVMVYMLNVTALLLTLFLIHVKNRKIEVIFMSLTHACSLIDVSSGFIDKSRDHLQIN